MTKSAAQKQNAAVRRELRWRRQKTAAILMGAFLRGVPRFPSLGAQRGATDVKDIEAAAREAVQATDILLAELDRTAKEETVE